MHPNPGPNVDGCRGISGCHANIRSLTNNKLLDIETWLAEEFEIITLSETFIKLTDNIDNYKIENFIFYHKPRIDRLGGGVGIYIKDNLLGIVREDFMSDSIKLLWVEIRTGIKQFLIGVCYRPPNEPVSFWEDLQENFDLVSESYLGTIITR